MSIDFHEPEPNIEHFSGLELTIIPPSSETSWGIAFDTQNPKELETYDRAIDGILRIEMMSPHLNVEHSTDTHHEWEVGGSAVLSADNEEVQEYLKGIISRIQNIVKGSDETRLAA